MRRAINLALLLAAFWLANSGHYSPLMLALGGLSVALVILISRRMDAIDDEARSLHWTFRVPGYWLWLFKETVAANLDVVRCIWRGNAAISPVMFTINAGQKTDIGKVIFANSITLTSGTVAVDMIDDAIIIHSLTQKAAEILQTGSMDRRVSRLEM